jgi:type IV pilus assembly protein PilA
MAQALQNCSTVRDGGSRGFTLIEMMIVVVIVGILATLAVLGYRSLIRSSHVTEATGMVQNIRIAQESYHAETQRYANVSSGLDQYYPGTPAYNVARGWGAAADFKDVPWSALPVHVDGPVLFGYATVAGSPGDGFSPPTTVDAVTVSFPTPVTDWFIINAKGVLDTSASVHTQVIGSSWTNQVSVYNDGL